MSTKEALQIVVSLAQQKVKEDSISGISSMQKQQALEEVSRFTRYYEEIMKGIGYEVEEIEERA